MVSHREPDEELDCGSWRSLRDDPCESRLSDQALRLFAAWRPNVRQEKHGRVFFSPVLRQRRSRWSPPCDRTGRLRLFLRPGLSSSPCRRWSRESQVKSTCGSRRRTKLLCRTGKMLKDGRDCPAAFRSVRKTPGLQRRDRRHNRLRSHRVFLFPGSAQTRRPGEWSPARHVSEEAHGTRDTPSTIADLLAPALRSIGDTVRMF